MKKMKQLFFIKVIWFNIVNIPKKHVLRTILQKETKTAVACAYIIGILEADLWNCTSLMPVRGKIPAKGEDPD